MINAQLLLSIAAPKFLLLTFCNQIRIQDKTQEISVNSSKLDKQELSEASN